jgi:nuclear pore complex protein Nup98-Nup96
LQLASVSSFTIGCHDVGAVAYLSPVDLRGEGDLCHTVVFDQKGVEVYPDPEHKPAVGQGLNQPARIRLERCYPRDRTTGNPIVDAADPRVQRKVEKLRAMPETTFRSYDAATGTWEFEVKHFSRYGTTRGRRRDRATTLTTEAAHPGDDDEDDEEDPQQPPQSLGRAPGPASDPRGRPGAGAAASATAPAATATQGGRAASTSGKVPELVHS